MPVEIVEYSPGTVDPPGSGTTFGARVLGQRVPAAFATRKQAGDALIDKLRRWGFHPIVSNHDDDGAPASIALTSADVLRLG